MPVGAIIAAGFWGAVLALVAYGLSHDARRWFEERGWRRDERRLGRELPPADEGVVWCFCRSLPAEDEFVLCRLTPRGHG